MASTSDRGVSTAEVAAVEAVEESEQKQLREKRIRKFKKILEDGLLVDDDKNLHKENELFVLETLREFPKLASAGYDFSAFSQMLLAGSEVGHLKEVSLMFPAVLSTWVQLDDGIVMLPLSIACHYRTSEVDLIQFIAEGHKDALTICVSGDTTGGFHRPIGLTPLHIAMYQEAPMATLEVLLTINPAIVKQSEACFLASSKDCFSLAYSQYGSGNVLDLIAQTILEVSSTDGEYYTINHQSARFLHGTGHLRTLLSCLQDVSFVCLPRRARAGLPKQRYRSQQ